MHDDVVRQFENKIVLCNCDTEKSAFFTFFKLQFEHLKLKKVIFTHHEPSGASSYKLEWDGTKVVEDGVVKMTNLIKTPLEGDGDFRSPECVALLDEADIVVTNPPFSLFREFIQLIVSHGKQFYVIGSKNAITYKEVFPLIKEDKMWLGRNAVKTFVKPDGTTQTFGNIGWFTNIPSDKRNEQLDLPERYQLHAERHPHYDNYDAIECGKVKEIPGDYDGVMGVPITFLDSYSPEQFEILGLDDHRVEWAGKAPAINGKQVYRRIIIKRRK